MSALQLCKDLWLAWVIVWFAWALRSKRNQQSIGLGPRLTYTIPVLIGSCLVFMDRKAVPLAFLHDKLVPAQPWVEWLGVALTLFGLLFAIWARLHLGRNWSSVVSVKVEHQLIRSGPYRFVRHPIYSGLLLALIGTALCQRELRSLLGLFFLWLGFTLKSRLEEGFMAQTFGAEYEDYRRRTGALIPRLP